MNKLNTISNLLRLKPDKTKCEIAGIVVLNEVEVAPCCMKLVNLNNETFKILGAHHSYNKNFEQDKNFCEHIVNIENISKLLRMRQLNQEGRIMVFKCSVVSKIIDLLLVTKLHNNRIDIWYKIQKNFI